MKRAIVTTTIRPPSKAIKLFIKKKGWDVIIVGDKKTPHALYRKLEKTNQNVLYLSPQDQEKKYKKLSDAIGWNCTTRRNLGYIEAYRQGAQIMATVDDDNIPYPHWGEDLLVSKEAVVDVYQTRAAVFDPLSVTVHSHLWHRGYPIELLQDRLKVRHIGKKKRKILVQADLWDGDPDIDAVVRLVLHPIVTFPSSMRPYSSNALCPFNSQNCFIARDIIPYYSMIAHTGRMEDIWASYIVQHHFPQSVVYNKPSVYQERNKQDIVTNLEDEMIGLRNSYKLVTHLPRYMKMIPERSARAYTLYRKSF